MSKMISRRQFLKGSAAAGITAAAASMLHMSVAAGEAEESWDGEYDVVVLGYGAAGANAAVAAAEAGASVLLTDKAPKGAEGGNSQASGQFVMATDDADQLYDYLTTLMGKFQNWDDKAVRAYCEGCAENFDWMTGPMGGDPELICPREHPEFPMENLPNTAECWTEWENPWNLGRKGYVYCWQEFPEYESGTHCLCLTASGTRFDRSYYNLCQAAVEAHDIEVWPAAPGKKLITDADGAVIGVVIEKDGKDLRIKANGGVVLATGGFEHNKEMVSSFLQQPYVHQRGGLYNDGDGVKMATAVGADLWHMSNSAGFTWTYQNPKLTATGLSGPSATMGVIVGLGGTRFMNEAAENRHGRINIGGRWISTPMPLPSYIVHDADQLAEKKVVSSFSDGYEEEIASGDVLTGETLEELAEAIRQSNGGKDAPDFNTEAFVASIEAYNKRYDAGEDADYGRPFATMVPVKTGPFYAVKIGPTYFNTMGGPRRNEFAQVINVERMPIEGLFSAGELGSIFCDMYNGSGNLGETMVFGRIAGTNAAARARGEFQGATEEATIWQGEEDAPKPGDADMLTGSFVDGTYHGVGQGFNGKVEVDVTLEEGKITAIEVTRNVETGPIGGVAIPEYVQQIIDTQSFDIDAVSTATNSMRGLKEAINNALEQAIQ